MAGPSRAFAESLRKAELRVTRQRLAVLEALSGRGEAVTAQDLHQELRLVPGSPGLATIYRTLSQLAEAGQIDTFRVDGEQAFRLCGPDHHHHLVCESCGSVQEVESAEVEAWVARMARRRKFKVTGHRADIFGLCAACG